MKKRGYRKKLVIISHTEHYFDGAEVRGWGPTVEEINFLSDYWDQIVHVACFHDTKAPPSALPYVSSKIKYVRIPAFGGPSIISKLGILIKIPFILLIVLRHLRGATEVQFRLPTALGLFLLPLMSLRLNNRTLFWIKYAGAWKSHTSPLSYRLQKYWISKNYQRCSVTINGFYTDQPKNCFSFENPSLYDTEIQLGRSLAVLKNFNQPFTLVFVGRLEDAKGVGVIINALKFVPKNLIRHVHFIGDGPKSENYKEYCQKLHIDVTFHGFLTRLGIHEILKSCDFMLLPSLSEGFPKVISEGACFGVVPIVSDVGSIPHYINSENGFICDSSNIRNSFLENLITAINSSSDDLKNKSNAILKIAPLFTFESYYRKINRDIFNSKNII